MKTPSWPTEHFCQAISLSLFIFALCFVCGASFVLADWMWFSSLFAMLYIFGTHTFTPLGCIHLFGLDCWYAHPIKNVENKESRKKMSKLKFSGPTVPDDWWWISKTTQHCISSEHMPMHWLRCWNARAILVQNKFFHAYPRNMDLIVDQKMHLLHGKKCWTKRNDHTYSKEKVREKGELIWRTILLKQFQSIQTQ